MIDTLYLLQPTQVSIVTMNDPIIADHPQDGGGIPIGDTIAVDASL